MEDPQGDMMEDPQGDMLGCPQGAVTGVAGSPGWWDRGLPRVVG